ncbi:acyltransferase [Janthinobacterium sp. BJB1]|uniref:acyltransferase family protein n=1 Tax=Janthinobacterium sp. GW458P TaxID=1981504 RepID=UPI000A327CAF|nr:acyltransferase [Janthinobacterium sp. BJB303]PJC99286.1 acyltransferase [Janthinobacterium sp. BJB1]
MLKTLQAGRALAAISVAAFHLSIAMGVPRYGGEPVFYEWTRHIGGVRFFFVLSGFIILFAHYHEIGQPSAWRPYIYRRFIRLYPIYWLYNIPFCLLVAAGLGTDARIPSSLGDWITSLTLIRFTSAVPPLTVAWSLFHEVAFYAVFSLLILNRRLGVAGFAAAALFSIIYYNYPAVAQRSAGNVYTAAYNLYFLFGMGAFYLYRRGGRGWIELAAGGAISAAALWVAPMPHELSYMGLILGFAFLLAGAAKLETSRYLRVPAILVALGNASYTIYLIHEQLQGLLLKLLIKSHLAALLGPRCTYLLVLLGTMGLGYAVYLVIERPLTAALRRRFRPIRDSGSVAYAVPSAPCTELPAAGTPKDPTAATKSA